MLKQPIDIDSPHSNKADIEEIKQSIYQYIKAEDRTTFYNLFYSCSLPELEAKFYAKRL